MGQSWSKMRKQLEQECLCNSLKGRVTFFVTRYPGTSDIHTRVAVRVDGEEVLKSDLIKFLSANGNNDIEIHNQGGFDSVDFYSAFYKYKNQSILNSLMCDDPLVRLFAILDRRIGKRTLKSIASTISNQPEWLQPFYLLRFNSENIRESTE